MAQSFPMNAWYAAAWDADIKRALLPRTICGKHVVMYRQANGQVTALEDACWHRRCRFRRAVSKAIAWCAAITA
jgi:phenylpropionate dioxygenase-like ring-hydroxylating dioxygenase large terminal subunit